MRASLRGEYGAPRIVASVALASLVGCFDGEAIVENHQEELKKSQLTEVDLGTYRIPLPQSPGDVHGAVVAFHVFGRVTNQNRDELVAQIEAESPELKHRMLLAIRELRPSDLEDPKLTKLRGRVAEVFNKSLKDSLVQSVGFHEFKFGRQ